jgi:hypothetical protein
MDGTLLGRRDKIYSTAIKGKKKEIAREDALALFYQLFFLKEKMESFYFDTIEKMPWNRKGKHFSSS